VPDNEPQDLRKRFHQQLDDIETTVIRLFALVTESITIATDALLSGDRQAAEQLMERDQVIDRANDEVETIVQTELLREAPMASELRYLLTVLRVVPELERSGDLAEHIAQRTMHGLTNDLTPKLRGLIEQMGATCLHMWRSAADAWADRDGAAAARLESEDDELDDLHDRFVAELLQGAAPLPASLQLSLIGRFYERLGDHAVNVADRVSYLAPSS
jgi:phosphate transport system protein